MRRDNRSESQNLKLNSLNNNHLPESRPQNPPRQRQPRETRSNPRAFRTGAGGFAPAKAHQWGRHRPHSTRIHESAQRLTSGTSDAHPRRSPAACCALAALRGWQWGRVIVSQERRGSDLSAARSGTASCPPTTHSPAGPARISRPSSVGLRPQAERRPTRAAGTRPAVRQSPARRCPSPGHAGGLSRHGECPPMGPAGAPSTSQPCSGQLTPAWPVSSPPPAPASAAGTPAPPVSRLSLRRPWPAGPPAPGCPRSPDAPCR